MPAACCIALITLQKSNELRDVNFSIGGSAKFIHQPCYVLACFYHSSPSEVRAAEEHGRISYLDQVTLIEKIKLLNNLFSSRDSCSNSCPLT